MIPKIPLYVSLPNDVHAESEVRDKIRATRKYAITMP